MKQNRYQKIKERADKKRPYYVKEIDKEKNMFPQEAFVMSMKLLTQNGGRIEYSWSEKNQEAK